MGNIFGSKDGPTQDKLNSDGRTIDVETPSLSWRPQFDLPPTAVFDGHRRDDSDRRTA
jgi:hypothetical protein